MLQAKIKLTDQMIHGIKTARIAKRIPAAVLARSIDRDDSYISSLELKRMRSISSADLVAIVGFLYSVPEQIAASMAEEFIGTGKIPNGNSDRSLLGALLSDGGNEGSMTVSEPTAGDYRYEAKTDYAEPELISDMLEALANLFVEYYRKDPKEVVFVLNSFIKTMQFDPVFTMGVIGIPFFTLRNLSIDERKEVLSDLSAVYRKHAAASNQKANPQYGGAERVNTP